MVRSLSRVAFKKMRLMEILWGVGVPKIPPSYALVPSLLGKASSKAQSHSRERIQSVVLEVTSRETSLRDNVLFAQADFILRRTLSSPKSLQKQLSGNTKYRFMIFVHFLFIVR